MPSPTAGSVQTALPLQNISIGYTNAEYQLRNAFPTIPVSALTGKYFTFPKAEAFADEALTIPIGGSAPRGQSSLSSETFALEKVAFEEPVYDDVVDEAIANGANPALEYINATEIVTDKVMLRIERLVSSMVTSTSWTNTAAIAAGSEFDSAGGGDPVGVLKTGHVAVYNTILRPANTWILDWATAFNLQFHPAVREFTKYTGPSPSIVPIEVFAKMFGVSRVFVSSAGYNTAGKGLTASLSGVLGDYFWIGYVSPTPSRSVPSAAYLFSKGGRKTETYREEKEYRDVVRCTEFFTAKYTSVDAGYLISNTRA